MPEIYTELAPAQQGLGPSSPEIYRYSRLPRRVISDSL